MRRKSEGDVVKGGGGWRERPAQAKSAVRVFQAASSTYRSSKKPGESLGSQKQVAANQTNRGVGVWGKGSDWNKRALLSCCYCYEYRYWCCDVDEMR